MLPGDKVKIELPNGYKTTGVVVRQFKNNSFGVREANGKYYVRCAKNLKGVTNEKD